MSADGEWNKGKDQAVSKERNETEEMIWAL
jgi:hypothetical protein